MLEHKDSEKAYKAMPLRVRILIRLMVWQMEILNKFLKPLNLSPTFAIYDMDYEDEGDETEEMVH